MQARGGDRPIVVVGGGLAGGNAAVTLRDEGFKGRVVLIGREPGIPFGRPPLSKTYLRSEEDLDGWYVRPADWYAEHDVERLELTVVAVDPAAHNVVLDSGEEIEYQKVLIATGGRNRRLDIPGADLPGIHQLRTLAECDAIKREAVANRHAIVVGMSFIGCEVAASLTQLGVRVTATFPQSVPLERVLGKEVGAVIGAFHRANGVELLPESRITAFEGTERVEAAVTANGDRVPCDFAVVGIGIEPDAHPSPDEGLAVRRERMDAVRETIEGLTPEELERVCQPPDAEGHPAEAQSVLGCLHVILDEEWEHGRYANRDLAILESRVEETKQAED